MGRKLKHVELVSRNVIKTSQRAASQGPWIVYSMTDGERIYIGRTSNSIETRHGYHISHAKRGTHNNHFIQSAFDSNRPLVCRWEGEFATLNEARIFEDKLIKRIPANRSMNIRQRRQEVSPRVDFCSTQDMREKAVADVNGLISKGMSCTVACAEVGEKIGFSWNAVYSWCRGIASWNGIGLNQLKGKK